MSVDGDRADMGTAMGIIKPLLQAEAIRQLQKELHALSRAKGWYDNLPPGDFDKVTKQLLNIHGEISEAFEHLRKDNHGFPINAIFNEGYREPDGAWVEKVDRKAGCFKPDGFAVELADAFIRLLDLAEYCGIDLGEAVMVKHIFNEKRAYKHGGLRA